MNNLKIFESNSRRQNIDIMQHHNHTYQTKSESKIDN